jgi:transcriptional regulator with GAF, ATPase, and Fis domain
VQITASSFKGLLLEMTQVHALDPLLEAIARRLALEGDVALARIWLVGPGDVCGDCPLREECPQHVPCLHLVSSGGRPREPGADWGRIDGHFRRFPIGVRKIGRVGAGETIRIERIAEDETWIADPEWAHREGVEGFGGVPLARDGEVLGVLGVFTRSEFCAETLEWLEIVADHAAAAIANARAFSEIERLRTELALENAYLREEISEAKAFGGIIGESPALGAVKERIELVAPTDANVLIQGESGTGKELVAREIHRRSERAKRPLIQVNCAAIPHELYESEFFGHARGAFTGATGERAGRFAAADGGTLFLDEVGEIPLDLQGKLLRVLQEGTYERVGEERTRTADVRIVAATNRDLRAEVDAGRFREDLYYRLDVFPIAVPALRERVEDVEPLARHFLARYAERGTHTREGPAPRLSEANRKALTQYPWPGNVRELQNVIERALIVWRGGPLRLELGGGAAALAQPRRASVSAQDEAILSEAQLRERERANLEAALRQTRWKISGPGGAAELLGIRPTTLASRIRKLGVERPLGRP